MIKVTRLKGFRADIARIASQINIDADNIVKKLAFDAFRSVVEKTPVDTGHAQNNWTITRQGQGYFIGNNIEYIIALENGHSKQSGKGYMVTRTLNELEANFSQLIKGIGII